MGYDFYVHLQMGVVYLLTLALVLAAYWALDRWLPRVARVVFYAALTFAGLEIAWVLGTILDIQVDPHWHS